MRTIDLRHAPDWSGACGFFEYCRSMSMILMYVEPFSCVIGKTYKTVPAFSGFYFLI